MQSAWREEVEFGDGRIIVVERTMTWVEAQAFGQAKMYGVQETTVSIRLDSRQAMSPLWRGRQERPMILEFNADRQEFVLVALLATCERYLEVGRPRPPYLQYALRNNEWTTIALDPDLVGRGANLVVYPREAREPELLTARDKVERLKTNSPLSTNIVATGGLPGC